MPLLLPGAPDAYDKANEAQARRAIENDARTNAKLNTVYQKIYICSSANAPIMQIKVSGTVLVVTTA